MVGKQSGLPVHQYLYNAVLNLKGTHKNLTTKFWTEFFQEFGLGSALFPTLGEVQCDDSDIDSELMACLLEVRHENPIKRKTEPFV
eukprot:10149800-Alexandrium_andersonii.AAC.1